MNTIIDCLKSSLVGLKAVARLFILLIRADLVIQPQVTAFIIWSNLLGSY